MSVPPRGRYGALPLPIMRRTDLSSSAKVVYAALAMHAGPNGCRPRQQTLAQVTGRSLRQVKAAIAELKARGLLESKRVGVAGLNSYVLNLPEEVQDSAPPEVQFTAPPEVQDSALSRGRKLHLSGAVNCPAEKTIEKPMKTAAAGASTARPAGRDVKGEAEAWAAELREEAAQEGAA